MDIAVLIGLVILERTSFINARVRHMDQDYNEFVASRIEPEVHLSHTHR